MIPAAVLLCGEFMSVDSAEMDMVGTVPPPYPIYKSWRMPFLRDSRSSILICSYIGTFVIAFVIGCAVVDDERIVVVMAYTTVIVNALLAAMAYLLYGRNWPWPSAALSYPRGLFGTRHKLLFSPPSARRTPYSGL